MAISHAQNRESAERRKWHGERQSVHSEKLIRDGEVRHYADMARLGHVSRARLSQIMDLLLLAPDIQEEILFLPPIENGHDPVHERQLREIVAVLDWGKQRRMWQCLIDRRS